MGSTLAFVLLWCLFSSSLPTAMARIFFPLADIPPVSGVAYDVKPASAEGAEQGAGHLQCRRHPRPGRQALAPGLCRQGPGTALFDLTPEKGNASRWSCTIDCDSLGEGLKKGFAYRVLGGGTWSKEYRISVVERPEITNIRTFVHYPEYMRLPERRETTTQDNKKVTGPEGGQVEMAVQVRGHVAEGEIQIGHLGRATLPVAEQIERPWFSDKLPASVKVEGKWGWEKKQGRSVHTEPATDGPHSHWFEGDPLGHKVEVGEVLFADAFLVPGQEPEAILLQWHDGGSVEHGALWGRDRFPLDGKVGTASKKAIGPLPAAGQWVRLEVPARELGLEGKIVRGMIFKLYGGQVYWHACGSIRMESEGFVKERGFPMTEARRRPVDGQVPAGGRGPVPGGPAASAATPTRTWTRSVTSPSPISRRR